jgi:hypothetical protein
LLLLLLLLLITELQGLRDGSGGLCDNAGPVFGADDGARTAVDWWGGSSSSGSGGGGTLYDIVIVAAEIITSSVVVVVVVDVHHGLQQAAKMPRWEQVLKVSGRTVETGNAKINLVETLKRVVCTAAAARRICAMCVWRG